MPTSPSLLLLLLGISIIPTLVISQYPASSLVAGIIPPQGIYCADPNDRNLPKTITAASINQTIYNIARLNAATHSIGSTSPYSTQSPLYAHDPAEPATWEPGCDVANMYWTLADSRDVKPSQLIVYSAQAHVLAATFCGVVTPVVPNTLGPTYFHQCNPAS